MGASWSAYLAALVQVELGNPGAAHTALAEAVELGASAADPRLHARVLTLQSELVALAGDHVLAKTLEEQGLALFQSIGDQQGLAQGNLNAAWSALDRDDGHQAARHLATVLIVAHDSGEQLSLARGLEGAAELVAIQSPQQAVRLVGAATALRRANGFEPTPLDHRRLEGWFNGARLDLGEENYTAALEQGQRDSLEHAILAALELVDGAASD